MALGKTKIIAGAIGIIILSIGVFVYLNFGSLITRTAEKIATNALGVNVNISSIHVNLKDKQVTVNSLKIANPPGYKNPYIITADEIAIKLNTASKKLIDFDEINVKGSVVYLEINDKGMNVDDLKKLANRKEQRESVGSEQIRVIIKHMLIDASTIKPTVSFMNKDIGDISLPALKFSNIGQGKGVEAGEAVTQVLTYYLSAIEKEVRKSEIAGQIPGYGDAQRVLDKATEGLKGLFK